MGIAWLGEMGKLTQSKKYRQSTYSHFPLDFFFLDPRKETSDKLQHLDPSWTHNMRSSPLMNSKQGNDPDLKQTPNT